ncbi:MAG: RpiB/LacA/LacB family sugar-phosphate isomerase [Patescibacteria group bacterium]
MIIYLATDHRGFQLKERIKEWLSEWGYKYEDLGAFEYNQEDDYPDFIRKAARAVANDPEHSRGIILGGSGQGEAMMANRFKNVRASVYYGPSMSSGQAGEEIIKMSREHNDSNILSLGASFLNEEEAKKAVKLWLDTKFTREERHLRRIAKLDL